MTDAADLLSERLAALRFTDLPTSLVAATKACILDTIGCLLAGTATVEAQAVARIALRAGGTPTSTVIGYDVKLPPAAAVMVNAAAIHQYDFDDTHDTAVCHPTSTSLPPALALAEQRGSVSGRDLITAVALGNEVTSRVAGAIGGRLHDYPWFRAPVVGLFGATASAAWMLGSNAEQHRHALGFALPMIGGTLASLDGGSSVRSLRDGIAYRNGVLAAELAMEGLRGDAGVFDGKHGYYQVFFRGEYNRHVLTDDFGERWDAEGISLKPFPSIRHLHGLLTAVTETMSEHDLHFEDIESVTVRVGDSHLHLCDLPTTGMVPRARMDALRCLPFAVGAALLHRGVPLRLYQNATMADEVVTRAVPKVRWDYDATLNGPWTFEPAHILMRRFDGRAHAASCLKALGHPDHPMTTDQRHTKFLMCAAAARTPLDVERAAKIIEIVERLEAVDDIRILTAAVASELA